MSRPKRATLVVRPSLAFPDRWSVDIRSDDNGPAYQAGFVTHQSREAALQAADKIKTDLETSGLTVTVVQEERNPVDQAVCKANESEQKIKEHLEKYINQMFEPIRTFSLRELFAISNWPKQLKALVTRSPPLLSLLILATLLFPQPLDGLLAWILPKDIPLEGSHILALGPLLICLSALVVHYDRARRSSRADRVRQWILQLVLEFRWNRDQFAGLVHTEFNQIDYAPFMNMMKAFQDRDANSLRKLMDDLSVQTESEEVDVEVLAKELILGDFARKIQALSSLADERDYKPKHLAIYPLLLIISLNSVQATMQGLLQDISSKTVEFTHQFHEGMTYIGFLLGAMLILVVILPSLIWTLILSWSLSLGLFLANIFASLLTLSILVLRPLGVVGAKRGIPRGLAIHECNRALNIS